MSFMDIFTKGATTAPAAPVNPAAPAQPGVSPAVPVQPAAAPVNPGAIPNAQTVQPDPNNPTAPAGSEQAPESPLEQFKSLWENVPTDPNAPEQPAAPAALTAEALQKSFGAVDFAKSITPETLAAITAGGEGAAEAFAVAMNQAIQGAMVQSTLINDKLTATAVANAVKEHSAAIPDLVREQTSSAHLLDTDPLFSNPAIKPIIEATRQQLLTKFPTSTPAQITEMTQNYIKAMGAEFAPKPEVDPNAETGTNWESFLKGS